MSEELSGLRKSAVVLLSLGEQRARDVLRRMDAAAAEAVSGEMTRLGALRRVSPEARQRALEAFCRSAGAWVEQQGAGAPAAVDVESADRESADVDPVNVDIADGGPGFAAVGESEPGSLLESIRDEHPQTIALVLSNLPPDQAGELLSELEPHRKVDVIKRIARLEQTSSGVIEQVERNLRDRLKAMMGRTVRSAGVTAVAQILNFADRRIEEQILADLRLEAPDLVDHIRRVQRIFDDLLVASDQDLRAVVEQVDDETIALALRMAGDRLKLRALSVMPAEQAAQIGRRMQQGLAVSVADIEAAQQRVAEVVHRLDSAGEIEVLSAPPGTAVAVVAAGAAGAAGAAARAREGKRV